MNKEKFETNVQELLTFYKELIKSNKFLNEYNDFNLSLSKEKLIILYAICQAELDKFKKESLSTNSVNPTETPVKASPVSNTSSLVNFSSVELN